MRISIGINIISSIFVQMAFVQSFGHFKIAKYVLFQNGKHFSNFMVLKERFFLFLFFVLFLFLFSLSLCFEVCERCLSVCMYVCMYVCM